MQQDSNGQAAAPGIHVQPTADVDERAELGAGTRVWHLAQIRENARIGRGCIIGQRCLRRPGRLPRGPRQAAELRPRL